MSQHVSAGFLAASLVATVLSGSAHAQNLLIDGGFDAAPQTQFGDRFDEDLTPWMFATVAPTSVVLNTQNLVAVDGPGGHDYHDRGPESDASGAPAGVTQYYIDSGNIPLYAWQYFTPSCRGTATAQVMVTNREGHGVAGPTLTGAEVPAQSGPFTFKSTQGGLALLRVQSEIPAFPVGFAVAPVTTAQLVTDLKTQFDAEKMPFLLAAGSTQTYPWTPMSVQAPVEAGQLYVFMAELGHSVNMDNASVVVACDTPASDTGDGDPIGDEPIGDGEVGDTTDPGKPDDKPDVTLDPAKEIVLEKACKPSQDAKGRDGNRALGWDCEIKVTASPAPFAGTFTFTEDPSAISGGANATIIAIMAQNAGWSCTPGAPAQTTQCSIDGADFDPSGVEVIGFSLLADVGEESVKWENCVSGFYDSGKDDRRRDVKGNCKQTTWTPPVVTPKPATFSLKKGCRATGEQGNLSRFVCSIYVTQTGGSPIAGPLTFDELFTNVSGSSAAQYIALLQGTPNAPNGWVCAQAPFVNGASCTISAADFNANSTHRIDALIAIPTATLVKEEFENCAQVRLGDRVVGTADCVNIEVADVQPTTFDVEKSCQASGERMIFSEQFWVQPYQCTLTVTTTGAPFTGPMWITEDVHFGQNPGASQIQAMSSADPWDCSTPPYTAAGGGNVPYCGIQGAQFPASGASTITVDLLMNASMDLFGAENCVSLSVGDPTANGLPPEVASDCFEIAPDPSIDTTPDVTIAKSCDQPTRRTDGKWDVACSVTISGANLPPNTPVRVTDQMLHSGPMQVENSTLSRPGSGPQTGCFGLGADAIGDQSVCYTTTTEMGATGPQGGSYTFGFTGVYTGPGGQLIGGSVPQNCVYAQVQGTNIRAPQGPLGTEQYCVPLEFPLSAVGGTKPILDPVIDTGGTFTTGDTVFDQVEDLHDIVIQDVTGPLVGDRPSCSLNTLFVIDKSHWMDASHGTRWDDTKAGIVAMMDGLRGNGSTVQFAASSAPNGLFTMTKDIDLHYQSILSTTFPNISVGGGTNWEGAFTNIWTPPSPPLVVFITAGPPNIAMVPNTYTYQNTSISNAINASIPKFAAWRANGSRVIGVGIGTDIDQAHLVTAIGPNVANTATGGQVNPFVNDVIMIPNSQNAPAVFAQIAASYCPTPVEPVGATALGQQGVGDGFIAVPVPVPAKPAPVLPMPTPSLAILKAQTSACVANRASQTYECGFRLSVTNTGSGPFVGPLVVTDTGGNPGISAAALLSAGGWACAGPVGGAVGCDNTLLNLAAGATTHLDLSMNINALRKGGTFQNCAAVGIPADRRQRVAAIQSVMNARGLNAGPVDGKPGQKTYAALAQLQTSLGLPVSREFDDRLFQALGLPLQSANAQRCVTATLPPMPAPPLQCERATTVPNGEDCACRFDNMERRTATSCQCGGGFRMVKGKGCVVEAVPVPEPVPAPKPAPDATPLKCEAASTRLRGDQCVCLDQDNAKKVSDTQCRCTNGLPMIGGKCIPVVIKPAPEPAPKPVPVPKPAPDVKPVPGTDTPSVPRPTDEAASTEKCKISLNGVCLKR